MGGCYSLTETNLINGYVDLDQTYTCVYTKGLKESLTNDFVKLEMLWTTVLSTAYSQAKTTEFSSFLTQPRLKFSLPVILYLVMCKIFVKII